MENASKALIIAGAILLAILIISLGIMVFRQASGVVDTNAMDEVAVSSFNEKFQQYVGDNVRGANVNALINTIVQNNLTNSDDSSKQVKIVLSAGTNWNDGGNSANRYPATESAATEAPKDKKGSASTGKSYKVETKPDTSSGYITTVTISNAS